MNKIIWFAGVFLTICLFCYADVEYSIAPIFSSEEGADLVKHPMGPNETGQTIEAVRNRDLSYTSWIIDPANGKIELPVFTYPVGVGPKKSNQAQFLTEDGHVIGLSGGFAYVWTPERNAIVFAINLTPEDHIKDVNNQDQMLVNIQGSEGQMDARVLKVVGTEMALGRFPVENRQLVSLGSLENGGKGAQGYSINDHTQIVGTSHAGQDNITIDGKNIAKDFNHAFIWDEGNGMRDLNTLIPSDSGWNLTEATFINNDGVIRGKGIYQGHSIEFVLVPVTNQEGEMYE